MSKKSSDRSPSSASVSKVHARIARRSAELTVASGQVIAARLALAATPRGALPAGQAEFARMIPEKTQAFAAAGAVAAVHLTGMAMTVTRNAIRESEAVGAATLNLAAAPTPAAFAAAQQRFMIDWLGRSVAQLHAYGDASARLQAAMLSPIHRTATANARRLG